MSEPSKTETWLILAPKNFGDQIFWWLLKTAYVIIDNRDLQKKIVDFSKSGFFQKK